MQPINLKVFLDFQNLVHVLPKWKAKDNINVAAVIAAAALAATGVKGEEDEESSGLGLRFFCLPTKGTWV